MTGFRPRMALLAAVALFGGCAPGEAGPGDGATAESAPRLAAEEVLRIGSVADPDTGFARVSGLDVDRDGQIYVLDGQDRRIRVYGPGGELLHFIGRRGEGPGEFAGTPSFGVVGDTVWASDGFLVSRLTLFDRNGAVLLTARADVTWIPLQPPSESRGMLVPRTMRPDGLFLADMMGRGFASGMGDAPVEYAATDTVRIPRLLYDPDSGEVVDTAGFIPYPPPDERPDRETVSVGGDDYYVPLPPGDQPLRIDLLDGLIFVDRRRAETPGDTTFRVTRTGLAGDTVWSREFGYTPAPFPDAVLDELAWRSTRVAGGGFIVVDGVARLAAPSADTDSTAAFEAIRSRIVVPPFQPPVAETHVGADARIWLGRTARESDPPGSRWLVLEPDGSIFGEVELPADPNILWSGGDTYFLAEEDELGVPWVVKYRLLEGG